MSPLRAVLFRSAPLRSVLCALALAVLASLLPARAMAQARPSLEQMAGQMLLVGFRGMTEAEAGAVLDDIQAGRVGGVILFDRDVAAKSWERNIKSPEQVAALIKALKARAATPLFVAVDQEGGKVDRLKAKYGFPATVSAASLGKGKSVEATRRAGEEVGRTLARAGFNLDFAPVLDVDVNPASPAIGAMERSFSADPAQVAAQAGAFIQGLHAAGVLACVKHFPGHGSAGADSHLGVTDVTRTWSEAELVPYERLLPGRAAPGAAFDLAMTGHLFNAKIDPDHPGTLSRPTMDLLRKKMGYDGVLVSDDLQMKAVSAQYGFEDTVRLAIEAGVDVLLFGNNLVYESDVAKRAVALIVRLVREGKVSRERIERSYGRIMKVKAGL